MLKYSRCCSKCSSIDRGASIVPWKKDLELTKCLRPFLGWEATTSSQFTFSQSVEKTSYSDHSPPTFNSSLFLNQSFYDQDRRSSHDEPIWLLLLAEFWRLLHSHSRQTCTSALLWGQCKERQPWWEARSNARRPYCQGTSPQPGQGGGAGRERREEWRRHQPVECSVNFCNVQWLCSSKTMRIYLKKKNLQLLKSQLQSSFSGWVVLKKAAHSREWSETFTPLFTAIDTWIDP